MKISIDRFEGKIAVCEMENGETMEIEKSRLPKGTKAGDVLVVDGETITIDPEETKRRKEQIEKLVNDLFD